MTLDIMGTPYEFTIKKYSDDPIFKENSFDGYCDGYAKIMVVCDMHTYPGWAKNEEMIDWLAFQTPKIYRAFREAKCL